MSYQSMLKTGKKNPTYVNIKRTSTSDDGYGGQTDGSPSILYYRILCRFNALSSEKIKALYDTLQTKAEFKVNLQYLSNLRERDTLVKMDDSREFDIVLITDWDEDNDQMTLYVTEKSRPSG